MSSSKDLLKARRELSQAKNEVALIEARIERLHKKSLDQQIRERSYLEKVDQLRSPVGMHRRKIVMALLLNKSPQDIGLESASVISDGSWPWPEDSLAELLGEIGFKEGSDTPDVLVLGEINFNSDYITNCIEAAVDTGHRLKIYTQELFITWLATGVDPLEIWSEEDLFDAVKGHAAMEVVFKQGGLDWPVVGDDGGDEIYDIDVSGWSHETPLKKFGYNARAGDLTLSERRSKLTDFVSSPLTYQLTSDEERRAWGGPSTKQRIYCTAKHLAWLIGFQGRDKPEAAKKWREDLDWLKKAYYGPRRYSFYWPRAKSA